MKKTNAARILDGLKISYELREYKVDESDLGAENVAKKIEVPIWQVFKTLVVSGDKTGVIMACIPGNAELKLKALAAISDNKKVEMAPLKDVQKLTGYIRGGVSPLGGKKQYPVYIDNSMIKWPYIAVSAGVRGCQILVSPNDLVFATKGELCEIARDME
ncbi:Cys-tRNA(Pro) deacylase [Pelosinus propionicus]|uniref:Cys-tRNA(Pro)/Cys-tRNA(Cys) deacylase n=1 Tax=Pelosinus propionicus DSM 13327 TaxID=1123291 RepID=A0A1I4GT92_9FIRM|nr:Cys-tRNA(Pro) deacylase [Pelosinus propionicus]SFL33195.1 Cys-tRNA(Pro)/Cys-tRNA(Cys) deacylase [Pelosinus propionicus DSM 13327]